LGRCSTIHSLLRKKSNVDRIDKIIERVIWGVSWLFGNCYFLDSYGTVDLVIKMDKKEQETPLTKIGFILTIILGNFTIKINKSI
jgi:hypothetical protein